MTVRHIPDGYHTMTPFVVAEGAAKLIDFIQQAFGAEEVERMAAPDGTVMHAVVRIGDSMLMLGESQGEWKPMQGTHIEDVSPEDMKKRMDAAMKPHG